MNVPKVPILMVLGGMGHGKSTCRNALGGLDSDFAKTRDSESVQRLLRRITKAWGMHNEFWYPRLIGAFAGYSSLCAAMGKTHAIVYDHGGWVFREYPELELAGIVHIHVTKDVMVKLLTKRVREEGGDDQEVARIVDMGTRNWDNLSELRRTYWSHIKPRVPQKHVTNHGDGSWNWIIEVRKALLELGAQPGDIWGGSA